MQKKILNILTIITGLLFINGGLNKFFNYMPVPENMPEAMAKDFAAITEISWLMPLLGVSESLGGVLLLFAKTRKLGILILFPVIVGILLTHIFVAPEGLIIALVITAIIMWNLYEYRNDFLKLLNE